MDISVYPLFIFLYADYLIVGRLALLTGIGFAFDELSKDLHDRPYDMAISFYGIGE